MTSYPISNGGIDYHWVNPFSRWTSRIGRVLDIIAHPCQPSAEVWAYAFWTAVPTLILTPVKPSPTDYLIRRLGGAHGVVREFDFDVWATEGAPKVPRAGLQWVVFRGLNMGARLLWYFALADGLTGYLVNWTSAAYQYAGCQFPGEAFIQLETNVTDYVGGPVQDHRVSWVVDDSNIMSGGGYYIDTNTDCDPSLSCSITTPSAGPPGQQATVSNIRVVDDQNNVLMKVPLTPDDNGVPTGTHAMFTTGTGIRHFPSYTVLCDIDSGGYFNVSGNFSAFARPNRDNIRPDP